MASCNTANNAAQYSAYGSSDKGACGSARCESDSSSPAAACPLTLLTATTRR